MVQSQTRALSVSRIFLWILRDINVLMGVLLVLAIPASFLYATQFFEFFSKKPADIDPAWLLPILRFGFVVGLAGVSVLHVFLTRLMAVVETVHVGDPFVPENAVRLKTMAWCALAGELLRLAFGMLASAMNAAGSNIDWELSATGWLTVCLIFVLAWVFEEGTRMRADLGTMI